MLWQQSKRAADELGPADNGIIRAELIGCDTAVALGHTVATHTPVLLLCRELVAAGYDPTVGLEAYRGSTLCLVVRSIGEGAELEPNGRGSGFRQRAAADAGPPMRRTDRGLAETHPSVERVPGAESAPGPEAAP
jgi:hypothetical protein